MIRGEEDPVSVELCLCDTQEGRKQTNGEMEVFNYAYDAVTQYGKQASPGENSWRGKQLLQKATGQDLKLILKISSLLDKKVLKSDNDLVMTSQEQIEEDLNSEDSQLEINEDLQRERRMSTQSDDSVDGTCCLTEEERETFLAEGLPLPNTVPFTKAEERTLKRIRRKIKNKISAQESRRKKKEYLQSLEKRMQQSNTENSALQEKVDTLERTVRGLLCELNRLRHVTSPTKKVAPTSHSRGTQTGTCLKCLLQRHSGSGGRLPAMADTYNSHMQRRNGVNDSIHYYPNVREANLLPPSLSTEQFAWKRIKRENDGLIGN